MLQFANMSGKPYAGPSDSVDESARAINCLWISSLIASLSTALIAILAKQWLAFYPVSDRENLREWAQLRQYRFDALQRWHVPVLIAVVPVLLHLSLMLFLAGLVVFLWDIDTGTMILAFVLSATTYGLYGFTTLSPVFWNSSPFRTPLTPVLSRMFHRDSPIVGVTLYSVAIAAMLCLTAVHAVTRSVVAAYTLAVWIPRRCVSLFTGKAIAPDTRPTGVPLYLLAIGMILLMPVDAVTRRVLALYLRGIEALFLCYTAAHSFVHSSMFLFCVTLHWAARVISRQQPSALPVDPWITQTVFSNRVAASAVSWLGLNSETTDIYYAVLYGLGDAVRGVTVANDLAPSLKTRIIVQNSDLVSGRVSGDLKVLITHLRAVYHLRSLSSLRDVAAWSSDELCAVRWSETKLRTPRDYDTLLRVSTILEKYKEKKGMYKELAEFFGSRAGQEACASPSSILPSTARAIAQLYIDTREPGGYPDFRSNVLAMLNALRSHFVASPALAAKLLEYSFADEEGSIKADGPLRGQ